MAKSYRLYKGFQDDFRLIIELPEAYKQSIYDLAEELRTGDGPLDESVWVIKNETPDAPARAIIPNSGAITIALPPASASTDYTVSSVWLDENSAFPPASYQVIRIT